MDRSGYLPDGRPASRCHRLSLHRNQRQIAVESDLPQASNRDAVEGALALQPRESPFDSPSLIVQGFPFGSSHLFTKLCREFAMSTVNLNDRLGTEFSADTANQFIGAITSICEDETRIESGIDKVGFTEYIICPQNIMSIASTYISGNRNLGLTIHAQMEFKGPRELLPAMCTFLDRPSRIGIRFDMLAPITPCPQSRAVYRHSFPKSRNIFVTPSCERPRNVFDKVKVFPIAQLREESAEGCLMGNGIGRSNPTHSSDEWVIGKRPYKSRCRWNTEDIFGNEALPEGSNRVSRGTAPSRAYEGLNEGVVVQSVKDGLKLFDDGRYLDARTGRVIISSTEGEGLQVRSLGWDGLSYRGTVPLLFCCVRRYTYTRGVPLAGIEPATTPLRKGRSLQLSYRGIRERSGCL